MHECDTPGVLRSGKDRWTTEDAAHSVGTSQDVIEELIQKRVLKQSRNGTLYCKRMLNDTRLSITRARLGKNGAASTNRKRWGEGSDDGQQSVGKGVGKTSAKVSAKPSANRRSSSSSSSSIKKEEENTLRSLFARWYEVYPLKKSRAKAEEAWMKIDPPPDEAYTLRAIEAVGMQAEEKQARARIGLWVSEWKLPATWLNQRCWEDEPDNTIVKRNTNATDQINLHVELSDRYKSILRSQPPDRWADLARGWGITLTVPAAERLKAEFGI